MSGPHAQKGLSYCDIYSQVLTFLNFHLLLFLRYLLQSFSCAECIFMYFYFFKDAKMSSDSHGPIFYVNEKARELLAQLKVKIHLSIIHYLCT